MPAAYDEDWEVLLRLFPSEWEQLARTSGAVARLRGFESVSDLLRTLLLHVGPGYSLRETAVRAKAAGLAEVSDVALLKRVRAAGEWWRQLCVELLREQQDLPGEEASLRVLDASVIREPGPAGSQWRLHYSLRLPSLACDFFELTPARGEGNGERLERFPLTAGEIALADRAYSRPQALEWAARRGVRLVVRHNSGATPLFDAAERAWSPLESLRRLAPGEVAEWPVWTASTTGDAVAGRLCAVAKSAAAAERARQQLRQKASKHQTRPQAQTLELAGYVLVWTNLEATHSAAEALELYRRRWQIELAFKRLKSLAAVGHLPKRDPESSRAWLYGKLLLALLAEKLGRWGREVSPWGYPLAPPSSEPLA